MPNFLKKKNLVWLLNKNSNETMDLTWLHGSNYGISIILTIQKVDSETASIDTSQLSENSCFFFLKNKIGSTELLVLNCGFYLFNQPLLLSS